MAGSLELVRLMRQRDDAMFIVFSSALSFFGAVGNGAYAAASSFQESLVKELRQSGLERSFCFSWTMWDDIGMSEGSPLAVRETIRALGFKIVHPEAGISSLTAAVLRNRGGMIIGLDPASERIAQLCVDEDCVTQVRILYSGPDELSEEVPIDPETLNQIGSAVEIDFHHVEAISRDESGRVLQRLQSAGETDNGASFTNESEQCCFRS